MTCRYAIIWILLCLSSPQLIGQVGGDCTSDEDQVAAKWKEKGTNLLATGQVAEAASYFKKSMKVYKETNCDSLVTILERNILKCYIMLSDFERFDAAFRETQVNADTQTAAQKIRVGRLYYIYSRYLLKKGLLDSAIVYGDESLKLLSSAKEWKYTIKVPLHLALVTYYKQDYESMETYIDQAYDINHQYLNDDKKQLNKITELYAGLYYKVGNYRKALEKTKRSLDQTLSTMSTREDTVQVANLYNNIGLYYIELGDMYNAVDYCKNALQLSKKLEEYDAVATIYLNMGELYDRQQELEKALFYYEQALLTLQKVEGTPQHEVDKITIDIGNNIAAVSIKLKRYKVALEALEKNINLHQKVTNNQAETYTILAKYHVALNDYEKGEDYYKKALSIRNKIYGEKHPRIASLYYGLSEIERKKANITESMKYLTLAEGALQIEAEIEEGVIQISDKNILLQILSTRANLYKEQKQLLVAFQTTKRAVEVLDEVRTEFKDEESKVFILQKMIPTYELSLTLALQLYQNTADKNYLNYAFQLIEKSKAVLLLDALQVEKARNFGDVSPELLEEEFRINRLLAKKKKLLFDAKALKKQAEVIELQQEIVLLKRAKDKLEATLKNKYPRYHELKYENNIATLKMVQQQLEQQTALIEYFVGNQNLYVFSVYSDTAWLSTVPLDLNFDNSIRALRSALTNIGLTLKDEKSAYLLLANNARNIYQKYVEVGLKTVPPKKLIVIPDGLLNYVPFEVLLTEKPNYEIASFFELPYLIKQTTVHYNYSSSLMLFNKQQQNTAATGKLLGFASSYQKDLFTNQSIKGLSQKHRELRAGLDELPGALAEVDYLKQTFEGNFYSREQAGEKHFKSKITDQYYSIIHLAMHGIVDPKEPSLSSLAFTYLNDSTEDDFLHAYELNSLHLQTDLVVLSACETGFGKYARGEGVLSIGRSFMYAGAPSLVMTLWSINDKATSILIKRFYQHLSEGYSKDEALKLAKLDYLNTSDGIATHPFFWASLISVGDTAPISINGSNSKLWWTIGGLVIMLIGGGLWWKGRRISRN